MVLIPFSVEVFQDPIFSLIAVLSALVVGLLQGVILGRAIMTRFPRL